MCFVWWEENLIEQCDFYEFWLMVSVYIMTCFGWKFNLEMFYMLKIYENVLNVVYFSFTIQYSSI